MFGKKPVKNDFNHIQNGPDRAGCINRLDALLTENKKPKGAVLKVYLENFKVFNDTFGYEYGGLLIDEVFSFLRTLPGAEVYRSAGVEFVVILDGLNHAKTGDMIENILDRFERPWRINQADSVCPVSIGAIYLSAYEMDAEEMLKSLDYATSEASALGQNRSVFFNEELRAKLYRKQSIAAAIPEALKNGSFEIRYRPTYCNLENKFTRAESYLQLFTQEFGPVSADEIFPIAEESGQFSALNMYVLKNACIFIRDLLDNEIEFETIAVPISPIQFFQEHFVEDLQEMLREYGVPAKRLALEISESIFINSFVTVQMVMQNLSDLGIEFVLNEFGTGYSGISNILSLPVNVLKLERFFVWQLETNPKSGHVIQGLIQIARNLGLKLIAEGVETENQLAYLKEYNCPYEQGFYYSPTVSRDKLKKMLGKSLEETRAL